mmetsp:Transcript_8575/g.28159  ORF Transcript_8575/g.28159 Transcript_8575/m.28159 type:complete len:119 (+) Transcript_8575:709-1065(+)
MYWIWIGKVGHEHDIELGKREHFDIETCLKHWIAFDYASIPGVPELAPIYIACDRGNDFVLGHLMVHLDDPGQYWRKLKLSRYTIQTHSKPHMAISWTLTIKASQYQSIYQLSTIQGW